MDRSLAKKRSWWQCRRYQQRAGSGHDEVRAVTTITKRIAKLEDQFGTAGRTPQILHLVCRAGWGLALDQDACVEMLGECGFLPTRRIGIVNLLDIPEGLS